MGDESAEGSRKGKGKARAETCYISIGCNRYSNVADVREHDGLVAYGAGRLIALWNSEDPSHRGVFQTLPGHAGEVTTVKFLRRRGASGPCTSFLSGDAAGKVIVWNETIEHGFQLVADFTLEASIASLMPLELNNGGFMLAVGTSHGYIHTYIYQDGGSPVQTANAIALSSKIPLDIALSYLPDLADPVMAVGTTDSKIHVYVWSDASETFTYKTNLPGHTDWVRCLSFADPIHDSQGMRSHLGYRDGDVLLASGSQDTYIRLWRFTSDTQIKRDPLSTLDEVAGYEIDTQNYHFSHGQASFAIHAESVLLGHENWVTGVHWQNEHDDMPKLLSASADRSMMMWTLDSATQIWLSSHRFGEIGGTNLGFFGALSGKGGSLLLAHGWGGSFHVWRYDGHQESWTSQVSISGHYNEVRSLAWEPNGQYLVSVSLDQTARLHGRWQRAETSTWHELARPQIHGYDMEDVTFLSRMRYISGSEEKIVRVFDAPSVFIDSMRTLGADESITDDGERPSAATVPALGLSNKAVFKPVVHNPEEDGADQHIGTSTSTRSKPPLEEQLLTSTLWPETEKLYGHGYEINAIAASSDGRIIASACRATTPEHAVIRLYSTSNWNQLPNPLAGHSLTITALRFSPDDRFILSVSRDRSWRLFQRNRAGNNYESCASTAKAHGRIIWDCAWSPTANLFATASRDKLVKLWQCTDVSSLLWQNVATLSLPDAATAVSFTLLRDSHILAVGTESGHIYVYSADLDRPSQWECHLHLDSTVAHYATVRRLAWQARTGDVSEPLRLASGSEDRSVRITEINLPAHAEE